jgi:Predicted exporters of the RND superfamily
MKYFFLERPKTSFLILILITLFLAIPISHIEVETSIVSYLPRDVDVMETLALVGEDWATENYIILIKSDNVFDKEVQEEMLRIESEINPDKNDGGIRDGVVSTMSLASLSSTFSVDGPILDTGAIFSLIPEELKNMLVSEDEKQTVIIVGIYPYADVEDLINRIDSVLESTKLDTSVTGTALLSREIMEWASGKLYIVWMVILFYSLSSTISTEP